MKNTTKDKNKTGVDPILDCSVLFCSSDYVEYFLIHPLAKYELYLPSIFQIDSSKGFLLCTRQDCRFYHLKIKTEGMTKIRTFNP